MIEKKNFKYSNDLKICSEIQSGHTYKIFQCASTISKTIPKSMAKKYSIISWREYNRKHQLMFCSFCSTPGEQFVEQYFTSCSKQLLLNVNFKF